MTGSLTRSRTHTTTHTVDVDAPAAVVYDLIADVTKWPYTFSPTVHVTQEPLADNEERIRLWALANGEVRTWTSLRTLDPASLRVGFQQEISSPPVEAMGGEWLLQALSPTSTRVVLLHDFRTVGDVESDTEFITRAIDRNSTAELAALKYAAELGDDYDSIVLSFADSIEIDSTIEPVYQFLYRAQDWPLRLPHVARLKLDEPVPGVQSMEMDTRSTDGSIHTTHSIRVCFPNDSIVYKQTATPAIMAAHTGRWTLRQLANGVEATSHHTVVIRPDQVTVALGPDGTLERARELIRKALGTNSLTTLRHAKAAAEQETRGAL